MDTAPREKQGENRREREREGKDRVIYILINDGITFTAVYDMRENVKYTRMLVKLN